MKRSALLIGQGLAGSLLGWELLRRGWDIRVIDDGHIQSSSLVAGGMWNPISFRNLGKVWHADLLIRHMNQVYPRIESLTGNAFFHPTDLIRIFGSQAEANTWDERFEFEELRFYLSNSAVGLNEKCFAHGFGYGVVKQAGWVNVQQLVKDTKELWLSQGVLNLESFNEDALSLDAGKIRYKQFETDLVISCTGWRNQESSLFRWLPIIPNKGEVLTVQEDQISESHIFNFGQFLLPLGEHRFRLGATFELGNPSIEPSEENQDFLLRKMRNAFPLSEPTLVDQAAGFRPTVPDRKPLIGVHPEHPTVFCFNGFGSRGVMTIPYLADNLCDFLEGRAVIDPEADARRYWNREFRSGH